MKGLFVNACVREKSRTLELCREYVKKHWDGEEISEFVLRRMLWSLLMRRCSSKEMRIFLPEI